MEETIENRGPGRPPKPRPPMRSENPRLAAAERAKQILDSVSDFGESADEFAVDPAVIPDGWSYEWKQLSVMGSIDPSRQIELARNGWDPVPTSRHPEMMPAETKEKNIVRKGLQLMERPLEVTDLVRKREVARAAGQMRNKKEQLEGASYGAFDGNNKGAPLARVKSDFRPMAIPD